MTYQGFRRILRQRTVDQVLKNAHRTWPPGIWDRRFALSTLKFSPNQADLPRVEQFFGVGR